MGFFNRTSEPFASKRREAAVEATKDTHGVVPPEIDGEIEISPLVGDQAVTRAVAPAATVAATALEVETEIDVETEVEAPDAVEVPHAPQIEIRRTAAPGPSREDEDRLSVDQVVAPSRTAGKSTASKKNPGDATVYVFANQKGGVAKTTSTLNLAVAFKEAGYRVLAIDLDPQGNLTMSQGLDPDEIEVSMFDVLTQKASIREAIYEREIDLAVASIDLAGAEIAMSTMIGRERSLEKALKEVAGEYDYICIDTPPSLGLLTVNALTAADKVIVPVQCEYLSMRGLVQLQNTLQMIRENLNPRVEIEGILPTMVDTRTVHAQEAIAMLEESFGDLVFKSRIRKAVKFAEAPVSGSSVLKYDSSSNAAKYYRSLADEVLDTNG